MASLWPMLYTVYEGGSKVMCLCYHYTLHRQVYILSSIFNLLSFVAQHTRFKNILPYKNGTKIYPFKISFFFKNSFFFLECGEVCEGNLKLLIERTAAVISNGRELAKFDPSIFAVLSFGFRSHLQTVPELRSTYPTVKP